MKRAAQIIVCCLRSLFVLFEYIFGFAFLRIALANCNQSFTKKPLTESASASISFVCTIAMCVWMLRRTFALHEVQFNWTSDYVDIMKKLQQLIGMAPRFTRWTSIMLVVQLLSFALSALVQQYRGKWIFTTATFYSEEGNFAWAKSVFAFFSPFLKLLSQ